jgi:hypothetical protein
MILALVTDGSMLLDLNAEGVLILGQQFFEFRVAISFIHFPTASYITARPPA